MQQPITITPGERWCRECGAVLMPDEDKCLDCKKKPSRGLDIVRADAVLQPSEYVVA